jgi:hypothetical protein
MIRRMEERISSIDGSCPDLLSAIDLLPGRRG